ncbi:MAG: YrhK family protein [Pseudomonadota bacterium]
MKMFEHQTRHLAPRSKKVYARFEIAYTLADFLAALLFILGSIMFFSEAWTYLGTWLFLIGSVLFATKPTLRLLREVYLYRQGEYADLAGAVAPPSTDSEPEARARDDHKSER